MLVDELSRMTPEVNESLLAAEGIWLLTGKSTKRHSRDPRSKPRSKKNIERRTRMELKRRIDWSNRVFQSLEKGKKYTVRTIPGNPTIHKALSALNYLVDEGFMETELIKRVRYFWVV